MYELILDPKQALKDLKLLFLFTFFITLLSFFIYFSLRDNISLFATRTSLYFIITLILTQITSKLFEEIEYEEETGRINYWQVITVYVVISLGLVLGFLFFPANFNIIAQPTNNKLYILQNNLTLAITFFLIAFLFGTGAEFLLAYNADILAYAIRIKPVVFPLALLEFIAFFHFALAGGILSISIVRNRIKPRIVKDIAKLVIIGTSLLVLAYFLEITVFTKL